VTAQDDIDDTAILEENGTTIIQDDDVEDITIYCNPPSGFEFPLGDPIVQCSATDAASNEGTASFTVTVNAPPPPPPADTTPPVINVPEGIREGAAVAGVTTVSFEVSAEDETYMSESRMLVEKYSCNYLLNTKQI
jgi:hypothetical protein